MDEVESHFGTLTGPGGDDARRLDALFRRVTGWQPRLWQGGIVGYGRYAYRYESGRTGEWFATGFSVRKARISIYILPGSDFPEIAERLGPHSRGKSCWYVTRLDRIDEAALADLIRAGLDDLRGHWPVEPS